MTDDQTEGGPRASFQWLGRLRSALSGSFIEQRIAAICGLIFVVTLVVPLVVLPPVPDLSSSGSEVVSYYRDHRTTFLFVNWIGCVGTVLFLVFVAAVTGLLSRAEPVQSWLHVAFLAASTATVVLGLVGSAALQAVAFESAQVGESTAKTLSDLANMDFGLYTLTAGAAIAFGSIAMLQGMAFERWIGYGGLLVALQSLVASVVAVSDLQRTAVGYLGLVAFFGQALWFLLLAVLLLVRTPAELTPGFPAAEETAQWGAQAHRDLATDPS